MSDHKHKIFGYTDCIPEDVLLRYVNGGSDAAEKHRVEKHTLGCDMCSDALEGLMQMKDPSKAKKIISELNEKIMQRAQRKPVVLWMDTRMRVAVAAGIALLIGIFFLFNNEIKDSSENKTVSDNSISQEKNKDEIAKADSTSTSTAAMETDTSKAIFSANAASGGKK